jgi:hypothetical protein
VLICRISGSAYAALHQSAVALPVFVISNANSGKAGPDANISVSGRAIVKT